MLVVETFNVAEPGPVIVSGLKLPVVPGGNPVTTKFTRPAKPLVAVTVRLYAVLPPARMVCKAGEAVRAKSVTKALKDRLLVQSPSVTEIVIADDPVWPETGVTVIVRFVPEPPMRRFPLGTSAGFEELALTWSDDPEVVPRFPKPKGTGPLEPPGAMRTSGIGEIWPANAVSAISKELLVVKCRNGAICSKLEVPYVISSM